MLTGLGTQPCCGLNSVGSCHEALSELGYISCRPALLCRDNTSTDYFKLPRASCGPALLVSIIQQQQQQQPLRLLYEAWHLTCKPQALPI